MVVAQGLIEPLAHLIDNPVVSFGHLVPQGEYIGHSNL